MRQRWGPIVESIQMVETQANFANRLKGLGRKHANLARGHTTKVDHNGLITAVPKRSRRRSFPLRGTVLLVLGFIGFKAFILAAIGPTGYGERLATLQGGTSVERAGAMVLAVDPVTQMLADLMGPILR